MCFKMVRTRQGTKTDPSLVRESDQSSHYESNPYWDPLVDTSSHVPATLVQSERGGLVGLQDDSESCQIEVSFPEASDRHLGDNVPPPLALIAVSNPFSDPVFMDHIVRAVVSRMVAGASSTALRPGGLVTIV
jgi:hypothetical protein